MRIGAISSSNYLPGRNINNKNNNPSFGEITNITELKTLIQQDVKNGKVTQEFADTVLEKLKTVRFNLKECAEQFCNSWNKSYPNKIQNLRNKIEKSLFPLLKENNIKYEDLPVVLTNLKKRKPDPWNDDFYSNNAYFKSHPDAQVYSFSVNRAFDKIEYSFANKDFTMDKNNRNKELYQHWAAVDLYSCFTELLNDFVDNKDIEAAFCNYADSLFNSEAQIYI